MSRPTGLAKTGGRVRGTPNKKTELVAKKLAKLGCDPLEGLAKIALNPETKVEVKVRCLAELAQYVYPKRKAVNIAPAAGSDMTVRVEYITPQISLDGLPVPKQL